MFAQLRGKIVESAIEKEALRVVIDVQGVGYEVFLPCSTDGIAIAGQVLTLYISESVTAFDGATTLYGFLTREEKEFFKRIRENVEGMGPKKALECIEKINKSMPDFKRAILEADHQVLVSLFGFTKKTAEKLIFALRDQADSWSVPGSPRWVERPRSKDESEAISGLINLGYREDEAREAVQKAKQAIGPSVTTEKLLQEALRLIGVQLHGAPR
ncbi:MAG: Holliday junction branch migration protein RuvA [Elusimicrobia bacterium]|nr:Holliday junction branch migration protein RuvA [Candidatus Obscuribacterium magneticum]